MNKHDQVISLMVQLSKMKADTINAALEYFADKTESLDDRWSLFAMLSNANMLPTDRNGNGLIDALDPDLSLCDDFNVDRRETVLYIDMVDWFDDLDMQLPQENIDRWKERVLKAGDGAFTYDW